MSRDEQRPAREREQQEAQTIDVSLTGTHTAGHYPAEPADADVVASGVEARIWIEQGDHAKQRNARKGDMKGARAAPDHPHPGHLEGSGEGQ